MTSLARVLFPQERGTRAIMSTVAAIATAVATVMTIVMVVMAHN
jgi:hypothetical protein